LIRVNESKVKANYNSYQLVIKTDKQVLDNLTAGTCHLPNLTTHLWSESDSFRPIRNARTRKFKLFFTLLKDFVVVATVGNTKIIFKMT